MLSVEADYLRMVHFGETVTIETFVKEYNGIKLTVGYEVISDKTQMVHCRGITRHCFINREGKPLALKQTCLEFHNMFVKVWKTTKINRVYQERKERVQIMKITLKDGSVKEYERSMSVLDIAKDISEGLARAATCAKIDGDIV